MQNINTAPFIRSMCDITSNMYRMGWDERNGGNISWMLDEEAVRPYLDLKNVIRRIELGFDALPLAGKIFIVTGTGKYFKNVSTCPQENLGIFRIAQTGHELELLWGYEDGGRPTSELPTHLMNHMRRLTVDPQHRVVMHCHPANTLAMTFVHELEDRAFTRTLWRMCTECIIVFPDGIGVLPWMVCGNEKIGQETANKIAQCRLVVWAQHGIFGTGRDLDEAFGLIETVEKAAEIYIKLLGTPIRQSITDVQLSELAHSFGITPRSGYLDV